MSIKDQIIEVLGASGELSLTDLVTKVQERTAVESAAVKAAVLPLISADQVDMTSDRKLHLHSQK